MKKIILCALIILPVLISCTSDLERQMERDRLSKFAGLVNQKRYDCLYPENVYYFGSRRHGIEYILICRDSERSYHIFEEDDGTTRISLYKLKADLKKQQRK